MRPFRGDARSVGRLAAIFDATGSPRSVAAALCCTLVAAIAAAAPLPHQGDTPVEPSWAQPGQYNRRVAPAPDRNLFATQGIPPMVEALQHLEQAGRSLKIGLFFDTSILDNADLTTDAGKQIFYATIRDYFDLTRRYADLFKSGS